jgi:hypothetical protein
MSLVWSSGDVGIGESGWFWLMAALAAVVVVYLIWEARRVTA